MLNSPDPARDGDHRHPLVRGPRADDADSRDAEELLDSVRPVRFTALTLMELEIGILRIERRDTEQGSRLRRWMDRHVRPEFGERTLPVDAAVALMCARLHVPDPRAERDALIAATAIVHGMTVVTGNVADFKSTGVALINSWTQT